MMLSLLIAAVLSVPASSRVVLMQGHTNCGTLAANEVCVGGVFTFAANASDADAALTTDYVLFKNGAQIATQPVSARVNGVVSFTGLTLTPAGTYTFRLDATGGGGVGAASMTVIAKAVLTAPGAPTLLRIIRINP